MSEGAKSTTDDLTEQQKIIEMLYEEWDIRAKELIERERLEYIAQLKERNA